MRLAICRVENGASRDGPPVAQRGIAEFGLRLDEDEGRRRREIVRRQLIDQVGGEVRELVLELELDSGRQERCALEKPGDHRVGGVADESAEPLGDARIFFREFGRLIAQDRELLIVELQEFAVHRSEPIDLDLAGVELHLGDELHRHVDRLHSQRRADQKSALSVHPATRSRPGEP